MSIRKILESVTGHTLANGAYACTFRFAEGSADPGDYRVRLFFYYDGVNDLSSATGTGLYAVTGNPCDMVRYEDWNGQFRKAFLDVSGGRHLSSYNTEVDIEFSGDTPVHEISFVNHAGNPVRLRGESVINGTYTDGNLPANILLERRVSSVHVVSATYDKPTGTVTIVTDGPHGFLDGDAVTMTGFPMTDHSCGVNGERFNGTYKVCVTGASEFTYRTRFMDGFPDAVHYYENCEQVVCTKWIVCEYLVDKNVMQGNYEALVVWPAHTFIDGDKITLCRDGEAVVRNAYVDSPAPNSFVCRSNGIGITDTFDSVIYAPRTPTREVPANYILQQPVRKKATKGTRGGASADNTEVDNSSSRANNTETFYPMSICSFDLSDAETGGAIYDGLMHVGSGKFGVIKFVPPASPQRVRGNQFQISVKVASSTEVSTELCMYRMTNSGWSASSDAGSVYALIDKVPMDAKTIQSDSEYEQTCNYVDTPLFVFNVPSQVSDAWCNEGLPVSLAFVLRGREGADIDLDTSHETNSFQIVLARESGAEPPGEIPVTVRPRMVTPGDTVSIISNSTYMFDEPNNNYRVRINGDEDVSKWVPINSNDGTTITFTMPSGYSGNVNVTLMVNPGDAPWDAGEATAASSTERIDSVVVEPRVMKLNDRMKPGEIDNKVSRSASYNRDLGYNGFAEITDENSMIQNLYSCLLTRKGERLFNPSFGTTLEERIFSLRTGSSTSEILKECIGALETYEPRINLVYEECNITDMGPNGIYLTLGVIVPGGSVETINIPFKNRGVKV